MNKNKTITLKLKQSTHAGLIKIAKEQNVSVSHIIRMVIKEVTKEK